MKARSAISIRLLMIARRADLPWNYSDLTAPYWRFYWNFQGDAEVSFVGKRVTLSPQHGYLVPPETRFAARSRNLDHFFVHFALPEDAGAYRPGVYAVDTKRTMQGLVLKLSGMHERAQGQSERSWKILHPEGHASFLAAGLVLSALGCMPSEAVTPYAPDPMVRSAIAAIQQNPAAYTRSTAIAETVGCDERTLRRRFQKTVGSTPLQYALRTRIDQSCMLLHFTGQTIEQIAEKTGFCDRQHFSHVFRAERGISPAAFRQISDELPESE